MKDLQKNKSGDAEASPQIEPAEGPFRGPDRPQASGEERGSYFGDPEHTRGRPWGQTVRPGY